MKIVDKRLYRAIENNEFDKVKLLVEQGANVNIKNWNGWTPMHSAARVGSIEIIDFLISKGCLVYETITTDIGNFKEGANPTKIAKIMGHKKVSLHLENLMYTPK